MPENNDPDIYYGRSVRREVSRRCQAILSGSNSQQAFDATYPNRKKVLVYVARIEETDESQPRRPGRCARCLAKGYHPCLQYNTKAQKKYSIKRYARCAYDSELCKDVGLQIRLAMQYDLYTY